MDYELKYLYTSLIFSLVLSPIMTSSFFLKDKKGYKLFHIVALVVVAISIIIKEPRLIIIWPVFNLYGLLLHFKNSYKKLLSFKTLATFIPFVFSMVASVWFVAGSNDLYLLGYNINWSFYAALHGNFLGWMFLGCIAFLSIRSEKFNDLYTLGCYICFISFLLIAFGIDGVPYIKGIGVVALTVLIPSFIALYSLTTKQKSSKYLSLLSLACVLITMGFAVINEFGSVTPELFLDARSMVTIHGIINAFVVIPLFFFGIKCDRGLKASLIS